MEIGDECKEIGRENPGEIEGDWMGLCCSCIVTQRKKQYFVLARGALTFFRSFYLKSPQNTDLQ
jgi:hypothetical protein